MGVVVDAFREFMSRFPTGVAIVCTLDEVGDPVGMTCSSLASVCLSPPTLLVCMRTGGSTLRETKQKQLFSVNLLRDCGRSVAEVFAAQGRNRFESVRWRSSPNGVPWIEDAIAAVDCKVRHAEEVGDHTVVFGEITDIKVDDGEPLVYGMRQFFSRRCEDLTSEVG